MEIVMPRLGESIEEGTVVHWLKAVGSVVELDEPVVEITTDKVDSEIPSPISGVLTHVRAEEGETVRVGSVLGVIEPKDAMSPLAQEEAQQPRDEPAMSEPAMSEPAMSEPAMSEPPAWTGGGGDEDVRLSPAVKWMSTVLGIDVNTVQGSGAGGRVTRRDLEEAAQSGTGSRVTSRFIDAENGHTSDRISRSGKRELPEPEALIMGDERSALSPLRRSIAVNLRRSVDTAVHALVSVTVDYGAVNKGRRAAADRNHPLTFLPFVAYASMRCIASFPLVSARVNKDVVESGGPVHLGIAIDLNHEGLRVPVIKGASDLSLPALADRIKALGEAATKGTFKPDELEGGTFTISNVGTYGTSFSVPIINYPQVAILCIDGIRPTAAAVTDADGSPSLAVRTVGNLSLSFDHRVFDGSYAAAFLAQLREFLEGHAWELEI